MEYDSPQYWNERYSNSNNKNQMEWYCSYSDLKDIFDVYLNLNEKYDTIVIIGCGKVIYKMI